MASASKSSRFAGWREPTTEMIASFAIASAGSSNTSVCNPPRDGAALVMNQSPPPTSHLQVPEAVAAQLAAEVAQRLSGWVARTRENGLRIPVVSDLLAWLLPDR